MISIGVRGLLEGIKIRRWVEIRLREIRYLFTQVVSLFDLTDLFDVEKVFQSLGGLVLLKVADSYLTEI